MRILRASGHRTMPWKNGGGSTTEIAVSPDGAGIDAFHWRISIAVVAADGPFSEFPGVDRTLSILDGAGLVLRGIGAGPVRLDRTTPPLAFAADAAVSASLVDGPITDLNVMTRRGRFRDRTRRVIGNAELEIADAAAPALLLAATACRAAVDGLPAVDLGRLDALLIPAGSGRRLTVEGGAQGEAWLVELLADSSLR